MKANYNSIRHQHLMRYFFVHFTFFGRTLLFFLFFSITRSVYPVIIEYNWESTAPEYRVQVDPSSNFIKPVVRTITTNTNIILDLPAGNYWMKITPRIYGIDGDDSLLLYFQVKSGRYGKGHAVSALYSSRDVVIETDTRSNLLSFEWTNRSGSPANSELYLFYSIDNPGILASTAENR